MNKLVKDINRYQSKTNKQTNKQTNKKLKKKVTKSDKLMIQM